MSNKDDSKIKKSKFFTFRKTLYLVVILVYAISIIVFLCISDSNTNNKIFDITISFSLIIFAFVQFEVEHKKAEIETFREYNNRYDKLNDNLTLLFESKCTKEYDDEQKSCENKKTSKNLTIDYLMLCSEEYFWSRKGYISKELWSNWQEGIEEKFEEFKKVQRAYDIIEHECTKHKKSYYEFFDSDFTKKYLKDSNTVVGDSLASTAIAGWNLLSLPFIPNDSTTSAIFGDDFGSNPYYVWGYGYSTGYFTAPYLLQGKGYWLGSLSSTVWDLRGTALESDSTVQDLELGFNLIGNNYVRGISKNTLQFIKSGVQYSFSNAVTNGLISSVIYKFNGTGYSTSDTLSLFSGYWLGVLQTGVKMVQKPLPSTVAPLNPILASPAPDNWELSVNASTSTQSDEISMIGVKPDATAEYDPQYDFPRPPRAPGSNYLELYFEHSGGNWSPFLGNKYAGDFISPSNPNWTFKVDCSQSNTALNIIWNKQYLITLGNNVSLTLTDNANNQSVNMKSDSIYTFSYNGIRTFTISSMITGISNISEIPTEFAMNQNYPNPFNPVTTIKYQLPIAGFVTIKIYDMLGKEVVTLVNQDKQAGYYEVNFNAGKLSSGIYFYKMVSGDFVSIKKLVILK